eukprot:gene21470-25118_t
MKTDSDDDYNFGSGDEFYATDDDDTAFDAMSSDGSLDLESSPIHAKTTNDVRVIAGADSIRYMQAQDTNGLNALEMYPEPYPPNLAAKTTSWNMSRIDQYVVDFCAATKGGDCHETIIFIGPLPPWFYYAAPGGGMGRSTSTSGNKAICNATDPKYCAGPLVDPSGKAAGEYYSRIISWFMKGGFTDELGRVHTGGHHFNFQFWEVLNEPDLYAHYTQPPSTVATYTKIYDGITTILHADHPSLQFAAMCWAYTTPSDFEYFFNKANHDAAAP